MLNRRGFLGLIAGAAAVQPSLESVQTWTVETEPIICSRVLGHSEDLSMYMGIPRDAFPPPGPLYCWDGNLESIQGLMSDTRAQDQIALGLMYAHA